jgi:hypothetical protein
VGVIRSRDSSVGIALGYGLDDRGSRVRFIGSRTALGPTQSPIQWVPGAISLGVKRPGREADHSPPSSAKVKECLELYLDSPIRLHDVVFSSESTGTALPLPLHLPFVWM